VEVRGAFPNRNKAATAARALARPRGAGERSEFGVSEKMVDLNEESSNRLFAVLSDWNRALQASEQGDFSSLKCR